MILITGATGNNGGEIVKQLLAVDASVRILVRDCQKHAAKIAALEAQGVKVFQGDLAQPSSLEPALENIERALLLSSVMPNQVELQGNFINASKRAGVKHIVKFSMLGADVNSPMFLGQWHGQTEKQLESSGIAWTHLQPNDLMQNMQRFVDTIQTQGTINLSVQDGKVSMVDARDVAAVAVKALTEPNHEGKTYVVTGAEALSYTDVAQKLSAALGKQIRYVDIPPDTAKQAMLQSGMPEWAANMMTTLYTMESQGSNAEVTNTVVEVTGKEPITFDQFAQTFASTLLSRSAA